MTEILDVDPYDPRLIEAPYFRTMLIAMLAKRDDYQARKMYEAARVASVMCVIAWKSFTEPDHDASQITTEMGGL